MNVIDQAVKRCGELAQAGTTGSDLIAQMRNEYGNRIAVTAIFWYTHPDGKPLKKADKAPKVTDPAGVL